jgi:hypothetical protein
MEGQYRLLRHDPVAKCLQLLIAGQPDSRVRDVTDR